MLHKTIEANGGWIQAISSREQKKYCSLDEFEYALLKQKYIEYFEDYRTRYFYDGIVEDQGLKEILSTLKKYSGSPSRWIDLGAGVVTLFWSMAINTTNLEAIEVCDLAPEALYVLQKFVNSKEIPPCYCISLDFLSDNESIIYENRALLWKYHIFNCLNKWPNNPNLKTYDLITSIGCFGLSLDQHEYISAFRNSSKNLSDGGIYIGVDWVRNQKFIEDEKHDNSYLSEDLIAFCAKSNYLKTLHIEEVKIHEDPYYDRLIIWSFARE